MAGFGTTAILLVIAIAALVALPGLLAARGGALGRMFKDFNKPATQPAELHATPSPQAASRFCTECGAALGGNAAFCTQCGAQL